MFSLYGISGPIFQGPLENLARLPPIQRGRPVAGVRRVGDGDNEDGAEQPAEAPPSPAAPIAAYRAMQPEELERGPLYRAGQIMQREVIVLRADDDVAKAWRVLTGNRIHQSPVLDDSGALVGIVSERNLLTTLNVDGDEVRDVLFKRVGDVMNTPVVAATPETDIRRIARVMLERAVDGVPIVDGGGRLLGFISRSDILNAIVTDPPLSLWR